MESNCLGNIGIQADSVQVNMLKNISLLDPRINRYITRAYSQKHKLELEQNVHKEGNQNLSIENGKLRTSLKRWKSHSDGKKKQIEELEVKLKTVEKELIEQAKIIEKKDQVIKKWRQSNLERINKNFEYEDRINHLEKLISLMKTGEKIQSVKLRNLESEQAQNRIKLARLLKQIANQTDFVMKMNKKDDQVKALRKKVNDCEQELAKVNETVVNLRSELEHKSNKVVDLQNDMSSLMASEKVKDRIISVLKCELEIAMREREETVGQFSAEIQVLKAEEMLHEKFVEDIKVLINWHEDDESDDLAERLGKLVHHVKKLGTVYEYVIGKMKAKGLSSLEVTNPRMIPLPEKQQDHGNEQSKTEHTEIVAEEGKNNMETMNNDHNDSDEDEYIDVEGF